MERSTPRIAIVGAGIAGLNAALTLHDAGLPCRVYEASDRVGGRMHSDAATWGDGMVTEWCGEFIDANHETLHRLISRFGLTTVDLGHLRGGRATSLLFFTNRFYGHEELSRDFERLAPILQQQSEDVAFPVTAARQTTAAVHLDHLSVHDWITRYVPEAHEGPLGRLLENACTGFFGLDTHEQSALNLLSLFSTRDRVTAPASRPLHGSSRIHGGCAQLPRAIAGALPEHRVRLGHRLTAIERLHDDSLALTFATADGNVDVTCDRVILALPFSVLRHLDYSRAGFDPLKRAAIQELGYGTISKLFLQFDQPYWYARGRWPHHHSGFVITDLEIQTLWDASLGQRGSRGLLVDYTGGRRGAAYTPTTPYSTTFDSAIVQRYAGDCLRHAERVFPGISRHYTGRAALSYPTGDLNLRGSYSCWRVGQYTGFAGYERERQGPILFAGEHCS
ncbi:MAG TPA: NAD(P)/FAD-dependent oxidoreductase, partial [Gemmatimonadaceae bacterium]|nr:NAD(P)/FAD-dependent oxidoreductase [Gemmatimonadaceae bacterium]